MSITKPTINKLLSLLLVLSVVLAGLLPSTAVYASEVNTPGSAKSNAVLNSDGLIMDVTVPTSVLIHVDENGEVTTPDYLPIINNSIAPVFVHSLTVTPQNGWTLDPIHMDYTNFKVNQKHYWLSFNGLDPSSEPIALATPIHGSDSLNLVLSAGVAPQRSAINALNVGEIVITLDWDANESIEEGDQGDQNMNFTVHSITHGDEGRLTFSMTVESPGLAEFSMVPAGSRPPSNGTTGFSLNSAGYQTVNVDIYGGYDDSIDYDVYVWVYDANWNLIGPVKTTLPAKGSDSGYVHTGVIPEGYTLATDEDFSGDSLYDFRYIGSHEYVVIPYVIKGVPVTAYSSMFSDQGVPTVKGVYSDNPSVTNMYHLFGNFGYAVPTSELEFYLDTTNVTNMSRMFDNVHLDSLDLSDLDVSNVTTMQQMFSGVEVSYLDFSGWNTSKVTDMQGMFQDSKVPTLDLTSFNTANVTNMSAMFYGAEATTLDLTSFNTAKVTNMADMFHGAKATTLDLSSFNTANVTNMSYMFQESKATTLDLTNFDTDNVSYMNNMFNGAKATTIDISSFKLADTRPMVNDMFKNASATTVYVRSQADIDYLIENAGDIPETINFVIK